MTVQSGVWFQTEIHLSQKTAVCNKNKSAQSTHSRRYNPAYSKYCDHAELHSAFSDFHILSRLFDMPAHVHVNDSNNKRSVLFLVYSNVTSETGREKNMESDVKGCSVDTDSFLYFKRTFFSWETFNPQQLQNIHSPFVIFLERFQHFSSSQIIKSEKLKPTIDANLCPFMSLQLGDFTPSRTLTVVGGHMPAKACFKHKMTPVIITQPCALNANEDYNRCHVMD